MFGIVLPLFCTTNEVSVENNKSLDLYDHTKSWWSSMKQMCHCRIAMGNKPLKSSWGEKNKQKKRELRRIHSHSCSLFEAEQKGWVNCLNFWWKSVGIQTLFLQSDETSQLMWPKMHWTLSSSCFDRSLYCSVSCLYIKYCSTFFETVKYAPL